MKLTLVFKETCEYEVEIDWPDDQPLPEVGTDGDTDWFLAVDGQNEGWQNLNFVEVSDRELTEVSKADETDEEREEPDGDDACDLCMTSGVNVQRTTPCGKTIGIECGCEESNESGHCLDPECADCNAWSDHE